MEKLYGKFRGIVKDNQDPLKKGRIRAIVPEVASDVLLDWALPCIPYGATINPNSDNQPAEAVGGFGYFAVPELETGVWVEFEAGNINRPIWVGVFFSNPALDGVPRDNVPSQALEKTNPDTEELDYPKENTFKSERMRHVATRRIVLELDQDTELTDPWDSREKYKNPKVEIGRRGATDEDKVDGVDDKNIVDIATSSRDLRIDTERDRNTESERDIIDWAHENAYTKAGPNNGLTQSTDVDIGNIHEQASNRINMVAKGSPTINSGLSKESFTGDAEVAKMRLSSGANPSDNMSDSYDSAFNAATTTIKLTGNQFAKLEAFLNDVIIRAGNDIYLRTGRNVYSKNDNGFIVETSSGGSVKRAAHIHFMNAAMPSSGTVPSHELGKPTYTPDGSTKTFLRPVDERAINPYNAHSHKILIPPSSGCECEPCDCDGGIDPGDVIVFDVGTPNYNVPDNNVGDGNFDLNTDFEKGLLGQLQNVAGTNNDYIGTDGKFALGAVDMLATVLSSVVGFISNEFFGGEQESALAALAASSGFGGFPLKYNNFADGLAQNFLDAGGIGLNFKAAHTNGPNFKIEKPNGILMKARVRNIRPAFETGTISATTDNLYEWDLLGKVRNTIYGDTAYLAFNGELVGSTTSTAGLVNIPIDSLSDPSFINPLGIKNKRVFNPVFNTDMINLAAGAATCEVASNPGWDYNSTDPDCEVSYTSNVGPSYRWQTEQVDIAGTQESSSTPKKVTSEFTRIN
jgi:hypothetical protein